ncbi:hypothetical protein B484DRAFT_404751 [Ochromonadaceae sp. CCMP2298]|nr:hypothetical protein B484DRAFT_404751 [Ochromonadaceae sp. CCMP2298]
MGGGASAIKNARYMGGKSLLKFFTEDVHPAMEHLFERFMMSEADGFEVFKTFALSDLNQDGDVDVDEVFRYMGGRRTKFTERLFYSEPHLDHEGLKKNGLNLNRFLIALWGYCTLDNAGLARYVFEIYDVDEHDLLEREDVVSMFRMLYDTNDFEEDYIKMFKFEEYQKLSKDNFCRIAAKDRFLLQPAIDYQRRLQKNCGGAKLWARLREHRVNKLADIEADHNTLADAVDAIVVSSQDFKLARAHHTADLQLKRAQSKISFDADMAERELKLLQRRNEAGDRQARSNAPDRNMHQAWSILLAKKTRFEQDEYLKSPKDLARRNDDRTELFELYDIAYRVSLVYWEYKDGADLQLTVGADADHELRYQDHLLEAEGARVNEIVSLARLFEQVLADIKHAESLMKKKPKKKGPKQALFEAQLAEMNRVLVHYREEVGDAERAKRVQHLLERDLTEEQKFVKKWCKKGEVARAEQQAHADLSALLREKTVRDCEEGIKKAFEERRRDYIVKEFDIITNFGSRHTKFEYVLDKEENRMVYVHRDSGKILHPKSAICEQCDAIFVQHELHCDNCNAPRSAKNLKLYRPLGFKDITLE